MKVWLLWKFWFVTKCLIRNFSTLGEHFYLASYFHDDRGELSTVIARLMSKYLWSWWKWWGGIKEYLLPLVLCDSWMSVKKIQVGKKYIFKKGLFALMKWCMDFPEGQMKVEYRLTGSCFWRFWFILRKSFFSEKARSVWFLDALSHENRLCRLLSHFSSFCNNYKLHISILQHLHNVYYLILIFFFHNFSFISTLSKRLYIELPCYFPRIGYILH